LLEALLEIADCAMTFRRRYLGSLQVAPVLDLLLADEDNPRSLAFQFAAVAAACESLPPPAPTRFEEAPERRLIREALTRLRAADLARLAVPDRAGARPELDAFLAGFEADIPRVSDLLTRRYLVHLQAARQYAARGGPT
jgi:uncharacterized alpha-E superfamily protein